MNAGSFTQISRDGKLPLRPRTGTRSPTISLGRLPAPIPFLLVWPEEPPIRTFLERAGIRPLTPPRVLGPGLGRPRRISLPTRTLRRLAGARALATKLNSLRMVEVDGVVDGAGERRIMGGERVKPPTPVAGGVAEMVVVEGGGTAAEGVGARLTTTPALVVVDGVPLPRTTTPPIQLNKRHRQRVTSRLRLRQRARVQVEDGETTTEGVGARLQMTPVPVVGGEPTTEGAGAPQQINLVLVALSGEVATEVGGARQQTTLVLVVAGGVPPPRTTTLRIQLSQHHKRRATHRSPPHQKPPGDHQTTLGIHPPTPGAQQVILSGVGAPRTTLGPLGTRPHSLNLPVIPVLTKGRGRGGVPASRAVVGQVGATHRTPELPPTCLLPQKGELRLSPRPPV